MIDFTFPPDVEKVRQRVREFMTTVVKPAEGDLTVERHDPEGRRRLIVTILQLREKAKEWGLWLPHMPKRVGRHGARPTAHGGGVGRGGATSLGPFVLNCQAPDEGNMHTLLHWGTDEQKEKYLRPLCEGVQRSCFAMTEPEVAGSDPTLIQTRAVQGRRRVGHQRAQVVHHRRARRALRDPHRPHRGRRRIRRRRATRPSSSTCRPRAGRSCATSRPWPGGHNHCEIRIEDLRVPDADHARRPRPGPPARPVPARPGAAGALHALDRPGRDGARHDGRPRADAVTRTARCWPRSRASSG